MSLTARRHKENAPKNLKAALVTVSSSRYRPSGRRAVEPDVSGDLIVSLADEADIQVPIRIVLPDNIELIREKVLELVSGKDVDIVISCGGTGISPSDVTVEAVKPLLDKELPGFGEVLRKIGYEQIGSPSILTRAIAGVAQGTAVFCLPGSPQAVELAVRKLIIPEVGHILKHARE